MENQLQTTNSGNTPAFIADAMSSLQKMEGYALLLINSGLVPKHFYELDQYRNPIKDANGKLKGNVAAVIMTIQHGLELGMSITQALQQIVPINGLMSVKGDGASSLIKNSGKCSIWQEKTEGSIEKEDYSVTIYSKRTDGTEKTEIFNVARAKRLGLWITPQMAEQNAKLKHGGWWKTPERMIRYRALGFIARDLYPDVIQGLYTEDEAMDIGADNTKYVAEGGIQVDMGKADTTDANNSKTASKTKEKEEKVKRLAGATEPKVVIAPEPPTQEEPQPVQETIQEPEVVETKTNDAGAIDLNRYEESLRAMSPQELGKEFRAKHTKGILPFSVEQWVSNGGSKLPKDLILVLVAAHKSTDQLNTVLKALGLDNLIGFKPARGLDEQLEIMDAIERAGADPELIAIDLGFASKEIMLSDGDKDLILSKLQ